MMKNFKRYLITSALPYANGPIHIGHLAGVYVPSDIYTRYLRMKGVDVISICGSDEHGVPITMKARKEGVPPHVIVDRYHAINKKAFEDFGISFDIYSRTSNKVHYDTASEIFRTLYDKGEFTEKSTDQYYDEEAGCFLADRYITGTCPHCGNENAYGDQCEKCGTSLSPNDLINPHSTVSGSKPVLKETLHWYLPLDKYEPWLRKWILDDHKEWKTNVYGQCKSWLDQGLQPRAVSRDLDWGIPVPVEGAEGKVLYVWFDAPIGYISATKELTPDWEKYWKDKDTRMIHFIGKDNIVFHCIIFPAILNAEGSFILPDNVPANEFLNLENDKISTSRNWAVWLHEYLEDFPGKQDVLRYTLCANAPETKDNDFTWKDFQARNNNELVAILGNFVNRTLVLTNNYYGGEVPKRGVTDQNDNNTLNEIARLKETIEASIEAFRFREALKEAMNLARLGNKYLADAEPWKVIKTDPERVKTIMNISLQITANLTIVFEPFLPFSMEKLCGWINLRGMKWNNAGSSDLLEPGHLINKPELLFDKIEDQEINTQIEKLLLTKRANEAAEARVAPAKAPVTFDDFSRMDIRTATILEAEKVPKTTKLLKLKIDTGLDIRTIVSGIAEHYEPEKIIGKQISIIANLEPRKIKGIESQGMILMAEDKDGKLVMVTPSEKVSNGSTIK
ncbi:MAG: methionine--tRNA ligase [Bacteroidetes bacterium GWE2_41_25]|nr:MAG: methionine--tRNA ligase [Bacteroidetes bacterium GWA2_40_15]OFX95844.1 MAG: methionine--tRNA ligase [Bacteroidetes bacterium GWC2_40_22]OFY11359.1 MAG: methionine--tRNA ligase [Bacteroidetes bacterium GWE2_41_25]OFY61907.1 MAG: methionine--tRNA ligase [Bacteroidetes bacterium GWF2_41_9]HAM10795.1 methionine--tRNA ligase [Bacteroidales bacterium]